LRVHWGPASPPIGPDRSQARLVDVPEEQPGLLGLERRHHFSRVGLDLAAAFARGFGLLPLLIGCRAMRLSPDPRGPPAAGRSWIRFSGRISSLPLRSCSMAVSASSALMCPE